MSAARNRKKMCAYKQSLWQWSFTGCPTKTWEGCKCKGVTSVITWREKASPIWAQRLRRPAQIGKATSTITLKMTKCNSQLALSLHHKETKRNLKHEERAMDCPQESVTMNSFPEGGMARPQTFSGTFAMTCSQSSRIPVYNDHEASLYGRDCWKNGGWLNSRKHSTTLPAHLSPFIARFHPKSLTAGQRSSFCNMLMQLIFGCFTHSEICCWHQTDLSLQAEASGLSTWHKFSTKRSADSSLTTTSSIILQHSAGQTLDNSKEPSRLSTVKESKLTPNQSVITQVSFQ